MWAAPRDDHNRSFVVLMAALFSLAWLLLWLHGHHGPETFDGGAAIALVFVASWIVMVVAMMLPTSLPLILLFRAVVGGRKDRGRLLALLITGYLGVWTLFGVAVYSGGRLLFWAVERSVWMEANVPFLGAGILVLAGLYQFTPLKHKCLERCRSPLSFVTEHWRGSHERSRAFRLGVHHGLFCLGCCWSLMLLMFVVGGVSLAGAVNLGWMLILGAVMATEKNAPWGRRLSTPLGVGLLGWGLVLILGVVPAL